MQYRSFTWLSCVTALTLTQAACNFSVDASLAKTASEDAGDRAGDSGVGSNGNIHIPNQQGTDCSGKSCAIDPSMDAGMDAGSPPPDSGQPPLETYDSGAYCEQDRDCPGQDQICYYHACNTRCSMWVGCVGPAIPRTIEKAVTSGQLVYYQTIPPTDSLGNPLGIPMIFSWDLQNTPSAVNGTTNASLELVTDEHVYFRRGENLMRVPLAGAEAAEQVATNVTKAWKTDTHVFWARNEGNTSELWSLSRVIKSSPERVATTTHAVWVAGDANHAVSYAQTENPDGGVSEQSELIIVELPSLSEKGRIACKLMGAQDPGRYAVIDDKNLYFACNDSIRRVALSNLSDDKKLANVPAVSARFWVSGHWLFWTAISDDGFSSSFGRSHRELVVDPVSMDRSYQAAYAAGFHKNAAITQGDGRLIAFELPPIPCSSNMLCPSDMSCGAGATCE